MRRHARPEDQIMATATQRGPRAKRTYLVGTDNTGKPLHVEIEIRAREGKPDELSITGTYDGGGGQILNSLNTEPLQLAPGWTGTKLDELRSIWERWHLNGMQAGCTHQRALGWGHGKTIALSPDELTEAQRKTLDAKAAAKVTHAREAWKAKRCESLAGGGRRSWFEAHDTTDQRLTVDLDNAIKLWAGRGGGGALRTVGYQTLYVTLTDWLEADAAAAVPAAPFTGAIYQDSLGAPCPECGYAYGSRWLSEPLPDSVYAFVDSLPQGDTRSPYDIQADAFLAEYGITIQADHACEKGNDWATEDQHWRITLRRGRRSLTFDFWNSRNDTDKGIDLSAYSVLSSLASESGYDDVDEAAAELELTPSKARALVAFSRRIARFFGDPAMLDALREIN